MQCFGEDYKWFGLPKASDFLLPWLQVPGFASKSFGLAWRWPLCESACLVHIWSEETDGMSSYQVTQASFKSKIGRNGMMITLPTVKANVDHRSQNNWVTGVPGTQVTDF